MPSPEHVLAAMREAARAEVLPRFGTLAPAEITEKRPGETVTPADTAAEALLTRLLPMIAPGIVVGEEGVETDPSLLERIQGPGPLWIVDPVDGTTNFSKNIPRFGMIVAYVRDGETLAGWILDPLNDVAVWAAKGQGAWIAGQQIHSTTPARTRKTNDTRIRATTPAPVTELSGTVGKRVREKIEALRASGAQNLPRLVPRYGTIALEYLDLARGRLAFMRCVGRLKPWDHAAGVLIHAEAGGFSALADGEGAYRPAPPRERDGTLVLAPDRATWESLSVAFGTP